MKFKKTIKCIALGAALVIPSISISALAEEYRMPLPDFCVAVSKAHDKNKSPLDESYVWRVEVAYVDKQGKVHSKGYCDRGSYFLMYKERSGRWSKQSMNKSTAKRATKTYLIGQYRYWTAE